MIIHPSLLDVFPRRRLRAARTPAGLVMPQRGIWSTPRTWTPGELVTALMLNQQIRDNENALFAGGISIPSQAPLDFIFGSTATQLGRLGGGTALQAPRINAAGTAWEFAAVVSPIRVCDGRLTLTAATPVTASDVTGATSILFSPFRGSYIALYDGVSVWSTISFAETALPLGTLADATKPYDVFGFNNAGTLALEMLVWSSTAARATGLVLQDGVLVKSGATTRRYLGTFMPTSTTQVENSRLNRYLWNYYNRVRQPFLRQETTASWPYALTTIRQANASGSNQVNVVIGFQEAMLDLRVTCPASAGSGVVSATVGIGEDSTTTFDAQQVGGFATVQADATVAGANDLVATLMKYPAIGKHTYSWNEKCGAALTITFNGTGGPSGIAGSIDC